jgi:hypothetical protein
LQRAGFQLRRHAVEPAGAPLHPAIGVACIVGCTELEGAVSFVEGLAADGERQRIFPQRTEQASRGPAAVDLLDVVRAGEVESGGRGLVCGGLRSTSGGGHGEKVPVMIGAAVEARLQQRSDIRRG